MWIALIWVFIVIYALLHVFFPYKYNSLRDKWLLWKIPGLPELPYFGSSHILLVPNEEYLPLLVGLYDKNKPIFRITVLGISNVLLSDIDDLVVIFNSRLHTDKSDDYEFLVPWLGTGLLISKGNEWYKRRKLLTPAFHFQILNQYVDVINRNAKVFVEQLRSQVGREFVEVNPLVTLCTLDVICETAMGTSVDAQTGGEKEYVKATLRMSQIFLKRLLTPWLYRDILFYLQPIGREQTRLLKILHGFTEKVIRERKEAFRQEKLKKISQDSEEERLLGVKTKMSFLDILIEIAEREGNWTDELIRQEVDTFMFEGHDTTAAAISWALFELGHHPDVQEKAYLEQCEIFGESQRCPTTSDLNEMKYLERVIKETLRLYPSVPIISRKLDTDVTIKGYVIPAGTYVPAFIYYIHRNPEIYPDPLKFDPDRFLPQNVTDRHPFAYIPFSAGARNCIGQRFAEMENKAVLSYVLRNFQLKSLDSREEVKVMGEVILRPKNNFRISFTARN